MTNVHELTDSFIQEYGEDVLTEILEHACYGMKSDRVVIDRLDRINSLNVDVWGSIKIGNKRTYFSLSDGNNDGTVFHQYGNEMISVPNSRTYILQRICIARHLRDSDFSKKVFEQWKKQDWFSELERAINYDLYQTGSIPQVYREKLKSKGLGLETVEVVGD